MKGGKRERERERKRFAFTNNEKSLAVEPNFELSGGPTPLTKNTAKQHRV